MLHKSHPSNSYPKEATGANNDESIVNTGARKTILYFRGFGHGFGHDQPQLCDLEQVTDIGVFFFFF